MLQRQAPNPEVRKGAEWSRPTVELNISAITVFHQSQTERESDPGVAPPALAQRLIRVALRQRRPQRPLPLVILLLLAARRARPAAHQLLRRRGRLRRGRRPPPGET